MTLIRTTHGFRRYAFSIQYNGSPFLGFSYQGPTGENYNSENKGGGSSSDLRGLYSIEGRVRLALSALVNRTNDPPTPDINDSSHWEQLQVSSRTDRGVHALHNTFHVDVRPKRIEDGDWKADSLVQGLNYYLVRQARADVEALRTSMQFRNGGGGRTAAVPSHVVYQFDQAIRILSCRPVPKEVRLLNKFHDPRNPDREPEYIDWNARYSASRRTYLYRIRVGDPASQSSEVGVPFDSDTSWTVRTEGGMLNIEAMERAAQYLTGTLDFTSFRAARCYRTSPIVTMERIEIHVNSHSRIGIPSVGKVMDSQPQQVSIVISGNAFLYRQVRNMVGCLVDVGLNKLDPERVLEILEACDRTQAPRTAPAHGLFLAKVEHGDFTF